MNNFLVLVVLLSFASLCVNGSMHILEHTNIGFNSDPTTAGGWFDINTTTDNFITSLNGTISPLSGVAADEDMVFRGLSDSIVFGVINNMLHTFDDLLFGFINYIMNIFGPMMGISLTRVIAWTIKGFMGAVYIMAALGLWLKR